MKFDDPIVRMWKRQLVIYAENKTEGAVPEHVKAAVFQRDRGRCVQCGYEGPYIEYDHKVPRSKGGPNTVENIQLLCRMCNLKKGDRLSFTASNSSQNTLSALYRKMSIH